MAWISIHDNIEGQKLRRLYKRIGCSSFEAKGILQSLWIWGLNNAQKDGKITDADEEDIARYLYGVGANFQFDIKDVVDALIEIGWIDRIDDSLYLHDWSYWQSQWYKYKERCEKDVARKRKDAKKKEETEPGQSEENNQEQEDESVQEQEMQNDSEQADNVNAVKQDGVPKKKTTGQEKNLRYSEAFENFWKEYPRKVEKGAAFKKFCARINQGEDPEDMITAAKEYAKQCRRNGTKQQFIKHGATFLGDTLAFRDFLPKKPIEQKQMLPDTSNPFAEYGK